MKDQVKVFYFLLLFFSSYTLYTLWTRPQRGGINYIMSKDRSSPINPPASSLYTGLAAGLQAHYSASAAVNASVDTGEDNERNTE